MQSLPLGKPNPAPKRRYTKKKTHGKADARGLTGAELADRALVTKQVKTTALYQSDDDGDDEGLLLIPDTPPRQQPWESQGGTSIMVGLPIRTPERVRAGLLRAASLSPSPDPLGEGLPLSTAPARLQGRGARKRKHTERYEDAVVGGDIDESQHGAINRHR
jgi:hypothetical protein